jgi:hypothetical protein
MARLRLDEFEAEYALAKQRADELRQPAQRWMLGSIAAMHALLVGQFSAAERLIEQAFELGRDAVGWNADVSRRLQTFVLRGAQGRLAEVEANVCDAVKTYATYPVWRAVLVSLYAGLERPAEATAALDDIAADGFSGISLDEEWLLSMTLVSDGCAFLGDTNRAALLYERLVPYADRNVMAESELATGSTGRALGKLAATLGLLDAAAGHFERAAQTNLNAGAIPWAAHAKYEYARLLLDRGPAGEHATRDALFREAHDLYAGAGMQAWAARAAAQAST